MSIVNAAAIGAGRALVRHTRANLTAWLGFMRRPPSQATRPRWRRHAVGMAAGLLAIAAIMIATMVLVDAWEITAARQLPYAVRRFFGVITDFGKSGWFLWPIGVMLISLALATTPRLGRTAELVTAAFAVRLTFLFVAIGLPGLLTSLFKNIIGRARPFVGGSADPFLYRPFDWRPAYASLPSGHTTTAVAAAVAIGALWPRSRPYLWTYALVIAVSRLAITAHHPSDVIGGAVVGGVGALLIRDWFAARRLGFALDAAGHVRPLAGPSWRRIKGVARKLRRA